MAHHRSTVDPSELVVLNGVGTMPKDVAERSMRLYAEKVVPRFDDIRTRAENDPYTGRGEPQEPSKRIAVPRVWQQEEAVAADSAHERASR